MNYTPDDNEQPGIVSVLVVILMVIGTYVLVDFISGIPDRQKAARDCGSATEKITARGSSDGKPFCAHQPKTNNGGTKQ